ncbi:MAG: hypothetical protein ACXW15_06930 [Acidimicrobiia bacterium]
MTYEKPQVCDFGDIASHTYTDNVDDVFGGCSGYDQVDNNPT